MKYLILVLFLAGCSSFTNTTRNQQNTCARQYDRSFGAYVYDISYIDEVPEYPGGDKALGLFLLKGFKYPIEDEQSLSRGMILLSMIIDTTGNPRNLTINNRSIEKYSALDKEILRSAKLMPKWKPGKCKGKKVPVRMSFPISIDPGWMRKGDE